MTFKNIGIAGSGLMGRVLAIELIRSGHGVTLVDGDSYRGLDACGYAGAGMLSPFAELAVAEPIIHQMGKDAIPVWREIVNALDGQVFFQQEGSLILAHAQESAELDALVTKIHRRIGTDEGADWLDQAGIASIEPDLPNHFGRALFLPLEGQVSAREFFQASTSFLVKHCTQWLQQTPIREVRPERIVTQDSVINADIAIDCRGMGGKQHFRDLRGVRGELIHLFAPDVALRRPIRLMHPRYPVYIVPRPHHRYLIGATSIESDDMSPITVQSALELLSAAFSIHPGFAEAHILESVTHARPALADNRPRVICAAGFAAVNGLYRHGFLLAPAIARAINHWISGSDDHFLYPEIRAGGAHAQTQAQR